MASITIKVEGLDKISARFTAYPNEYTRGAKKAMEAALLYIQSQVPSYPNPPPTSTYKRTGTLGRTLGAGGKPDIFKVVGTGGFIVGQFGTRLNYARYVVGDADTEQAWMHKGRWWTLPQTVLEKSTEGIEKIFTILAEELAKWLEGK
jgi:hypothetical protein